MKFKKYAFVAFTFCIAVNAVSQPLTNKKGGNYQFTVVKNLDATPVENQGQSNTCWSFSTLSFLESEMLRMGKPKVNLSEMFVARKAYFDKAEKFVRMHGNVNFAAGGAFHDAAYIIKKYGIVPEEIYTGRVNGEQTIAHFEMDAVLRAMVDVIIKQQKPTDNWKKAVNGALDGYLGVIPENFQYNGKSYTPKSYAESLGLNMDNYAEITSFSHHPFYSKFVLEIPDNWAAEKINNIPLNDMMAVIDNAIMNGYTVAWGADVTETGFSHKNGVAIIPDVDWADVKKEKTDSVINTPGKQKEITQEYRQQTLHNYKTQTNHGIHIL